METPGIPGNKGVKHEKRIMGVLLAGVLVISLFAGCGKQRDGVDYADKSNWAYYGIGEGKEAA